MFAANSADATLIRSDGSGDKVSIPINLDKVSKVREKRSEFFVRANDEIDVPYSDVKIGPYIFYNLLTRVPVFPTIYDAGRKMTQPHSRHHAVSRTLDSDDRVHLL